MKLVTTYPNADLDGVACSVAYTELLRRRGEKAEPAVFGNIHPEARFVLDHLDEEFDLEAPDEWNEVVLVDVSEPEIIPEEVEVEDFVEVIDHREDHGASKFGNAESQVEMVGAAATLIAERFREAGFKPGKSSAVLLYTAIVSNTLNFQASVTTERDREIADWLRPQVEIPDGIVRKMFEEKSKIERPLKEVFIEDFKTKEFGERVGIAQLEIIDVEKFVDRNLDEIMEALNEIEVEKNLDYVFLTCSDLEEGFNVFVAHSGDTRRLLSDALGVEFSGSRARLDELMLRKEIVPELRKVLESKPSY